MTIYEVYQKLCRWPQRLDGANIPNRKLGRWLVGRRMNSHLGHSWPTFSMRTPVEGQFTRIIGIHPVCIAINGIDGAVHRPEWYGDPTDDEKAEIILLI
jgi:hypothetical protein